MAAQMASPPGMEQTQILQLLVQEAQQDIGNLRAQLHSAQRLADERRHALEAMTLARDQLSATAHQLEGRLSVTQEQLKHLPRLQHELQDLHEQHQRLQKEQQLQLQARRILEAELSEERTARTAAEEAKAKAESERTRLQLVQDDLAAQVRFARQKAVDAEEEQLRAEEDSAVLRKELAILQAAHASASGTTADRTSAGLSAGAAARGADARGSESAALRAELQAQQAQVSSLMQALQDVRAEAGVYKAEEARLRQQLQDANQRLQKLSQPQTQQDRSSVAAVQLQQQQEQQAALEARLSASEAQLGTARAQVARLQQQLAQAQEQSAAAARAASGSTAVFVAAGSSKVDEDLSEQVELLMSKVVTLKKSRDKLLAQLDKQSLELEQMMLETQAAADGSVAAQSECKNWQSQAQDSLTTISRLQDLLSESSSWEAAHTCQGSEGQAANGIDNGQPDVPSLHAALLHEQAKSANLDMQVRVLSAQLVRACAAYRTAGRSLLPMLGGLESKLASLKAHTSVVNS